MKVEAPEVHVAPFVEFLKVPGARWHDQSRCRNETWAEDLWGALGSAESDTSYSEGWSGSGYRGRFEPSGKKIKVKKMQGVIGGETLFIAGELDISKTNLEKGFPGVNLKIQGMNLPLARNPDYYPKSRPGFNGSE